MPTTRHIMFFVASLMSSPMIDTFAGPSQFVVLNKTHPQERLTITCLDQWCNHFEVVYPRFDGTVDRKEWAINNLQKVAYAKIDRSENYEHTLNNFGLTSAPYGITANLLKGYHGNGNIAEDWRDGYEARAIGRCTLAIFASILDTIILPYTVAEYASANNYRDENQRTRQRRRTAKKLLQSINQGGTIKLKDRKFDQLRTLLMQ